MSSNVKRPSTESKVSQVPTEATKSNDKTMPNPISTINKKAETDFIKHLFNVVQGVNHDALCPHALPYYACMSCSH